MFRKLKFPLICLFLLGLGLVLGAALLPLVWESQSLYYKFGIQKALLLTGKAVGAAALALMVIQALVMARFRIIDRHLGVRQRFSLHRRIGIVILVLLLLHPLLVLWADGFTLYTFSWRYWPEFLGVTALISALFLVLLSLFRQGLGMKFSVWQVFHRLSAPLTTLMVFVHAGFVSGTFDHNLPKVALILAGSLVLVLTIRQFTNRRQRPPQKGDQT